MKKLSAPNADFIIKSAIQQKQDAFGRYRDIQIKCLQNTHIKDDGNIIYVYDVAEMNRKLAEAEHDFINASKYLEELLKDKENKTIED